MKVTSKQKEVKRRNENFAEKIQTKIWYEQAHKDNPYIAENIYCHGYDLLDLMKNKSLVDVLYLLYKGELPDPASREILDKLMVWLINPGPRHPATQAAMNAGVGKTNLMHLLPIAEIVMGGERDCAGAIEKSVCFLRKNCNKKTELVVSELLLESTENYESLPGFGSYYGAIDIYSQKIADYLLTLPGAGKILHWGNNFAKNLHQYSAGWLKIGIAAAVFADLKFPPKICGPLFQLLSAPGMLAHGYEFSSKPLTSMPYVKDENYVIKK